MRGSWTPAPTVTETYFVKVPVLWRLGLYLRRTRIRPVIRKDVRYVKIKETQS